MVNDHFSHLTDGTQIQSPLIWECTRFCIARGANPGVAAALMLACGEVVRAFGVAHCVGVFDARMVRIYKRIGACPEILGYQGEGREMIAIGLWECSDEAQSEGAARLGISPDQSRRWLADSFGWPISDDTDPAPVQARHRVMSNIAALPRAMAWAGQQAAC